MEKGINVLIHCNAGGKKNIFQSSKFEKFYFLFLVSRSATVTISYLCYKFKLKPDEALKLVRKTRQVCFPNSGFLSQLNKVYNSSENEKETKPEGGEI